MRFSEANRGRTFIIRLEDGDVLHECIEDFALAHGIRAAAIIAVGGVIALRTDTLIRSA